MCIYIYVYLCFLCICVYLIICMYIYSNAVTTPKLLPPRLPLDLELISLAFSLHLLHSHSYPSKDRMSPLSYWPPDLTTVYLFTR